MMLSEDSGWPICISDEIAINSHSISLYPVVHFVVFCIVFVC